MKCIYVNIQSIIKNKPHLEIICRDHDPFIIFCSESCTTDKIIDSEISLDGYNIVRCDSHSRHTGGAIIYLKTSIKYAVLLCKSFENNTWCVSVDVSSKFVKGIYTVLYHSPNTSDTTFLKSLDEICNTCINLSKSCVVVGDFNIDMCKENSNTNKLEQVINTHGLKQIVTFHTRVTQQTNTMIDLILTNNEKMRCEPLMNDKISDHETISMYVEQETQETDNKTVITSWKNYNVVELQTYLHTIQWNTFFVSTLEDKLYDLCNVLSAAVNSLVVRKELSTKKQNRWFSKDLQELKKIKNRKYQRAVLTRNDEDYEAYNVARNTYRRSVENTRNLFVQKQIETAKNDSRSMWRCLKKLVNCKEKQNVNNDASIERQFRCYRILLRQHYK